jgi:hypothetical protein
MILLVDGLDIDNLLEVMKMSYSSRSGEGLLIILIVMGILPTRVLTT